MKNLRKTAFTLSALTLLLAVIATPKDAQACGRDFDVLAVPIGAGIGSAALLPAVFGFPGIVAGTSEGLAYWPGVGWASLGGSLGLAAGLGVQMATGDCFSNMWMPPVFATSGALIATLVWGLTAKRKNRYDDGYGQAKLPVLVGITPLPKGGVYANASLTW